MLVHREALLHLLEHGVERAHVRLRRAVAERIVGADDNVAVALGGIAEEADRNHGAPARVHEEEHRPSAVGAVPRREVDCGGLR